VAVHPRTAALLARRLLETEVSAVLDVSELKAHERHSFVRLFVESLIEAPKSLRHSVILAVDECQVYAPEKGQGESEASPAIIDVATRGRKRGLCLVAATQRISMLHKAVAAECKNRLIGGTTLDVDVKRAAFDLGLSAKEALEVLRGLPPGHFYAYGPALKQPEPRQMVTGDVVTTHPKVGHKQMVAPPKPTPAILAMLPKLADLPKEAEHEAKTLADVKAELAATKRELTIAKKTQPDINPESLTKAHAEGFNLGAQKMADTTRKVIGDISKWHAQFPGANFTISEFKFKDVPKPNWSTREPIPVKAQATLTGSYKKIHKGNGDSKLSKAGLKILSVLFQFPEGCASGKLTLLTGYSYSGSFQNALSELRTAGCIEGANNEIMRITDAGLAHGPFPELPQGEARLQYWLNNSRFSKASKMILEALSDGREKTADELCEITGYSYSGSFQNSLSELRTAGVLMGRNNECMRISTEIVP